MLWLTLLLSCSALAGPIFKNSTEEELFLEDGDLFLDNYVQNPINTNETDLRGFNLSLSSINASLNSMKVSDTSINDPPYQMMHQNNRER